MKPVCIPHNIRAITLNQIDQGALPLATLLLLKEHPSNVQLLIAKNQRRLHTWIAGLTALWPHYFANTPLQTHIIPDPEEFENNNHAAFDGNCDRLAALTALEHEQETQSPGILFIASTPKALLQALPSPSQFNDHSILLHSGHAYSFEKLKQQLGHELNYDYEMVCEAPGQFAVRGGLIDVYPLNADAPIRIDFFGDEIESIRSFDPTSQRSEAPLEDIRISSAATKFQSLKQSNILDYLHDRVNWFISEAADLEKTFNQQFTTPQKIAPPSNSFSHIFLKRIKREDTWFNLQQIDESSAFFTHAIPMCKVSSEGLITPCILTENEAVGLIRHEQDQRSRLQFCKQLLTWQKEGYHIHIALPNLAEQERFEAIIQEEMGLPELKPRYIQATLTQGCRLSWPQPNGNPLKIIYTSDNEFLGRSKHITIKKRRKSVQRSAVEHALDFAELADGDHLVHQQHGVCIFRGLQKMDLGRPSNEEVIKLEFAEQITLYLPLHESHLLNRYVGLSKSMPKLGRMGSKQWEKSKKAAEQASFDFAARLLRMQAEREAEPGHAFPPDHEWLKHFENAFIYQETSDQMQAIVETKSDMEKPTPMDRLICGDVGFGKTEIALRAAFKAVLDGKQVALLVPTTILCQQHANTFRERFADYPVVVEMLSRFRSPKQQKEICQQLKAGCIDIVIGTHSLLSKTVQFAQLGLLIIDEEHRFGVRQKERIKQMRQHIDVLAMSATPIPRTLYSALMGVRTMSVIETAPSDRLPIETQVKGYDPQLVKKVIEYEINRGGQVFYLHNRVQTIDDVASQLQELVPHIRIAVGHGQMEENELERIMNDFVAGRYDVLVCTTIIENGLDIPNCNTIIIDAANRFGLSQLYQLRGRVGRFNRQAYAYLLLHRHAKVLDSARKRLGAIRQHNQLGAGFRIAMRDLELRGAGNLLGPQQSGHIVNIGFELYCQLLKQSIARLKDGNTRPPIQASLRLDFITQEAQKTQAHIPNSYIQEPQLRIDAYRKLAMAATIKEVDAIANEFKDRFGKLPTPVRTLLSTTKIRIQAELANIISVETTDSKLKCRFAKSKGEKFLMIGKRFPRLQAQSPQNKLKEILAILKNPK